MSHQLAMVRRVQSPEKELRFTRGRQAVAFWMIAAVAAAAATTMLATSIYRDINPLLPHPLWTAIPLAISLAAGRFAVQLTRHAYVIVTPLGIEIFPLMRPEKNLRLVFWQEIAAAEVNPAMTMLTLHHNLEKTSGVRLSLCPIARNRRGFLVSAVCGRVGGGE